ncbi:MAG: 5'/3'-nucleotidase SurE [Candidatus Riflebacteria bacterium]|nr:5'/3'-nucleotidase SurE [Candidatus Riflebacteria bacterium]
MHILISNDDGFSARGIVALAGILSQIAEITVVAPDREQSACSSSLSIHKPLRATAVDFPVKVHAAWAVDGTPVDSVKLALTKLMPVPPDLVVTGINRGANMCVDILYSGTVAAAFEGVFKGIPSLAFSLDSYDSKADYSAAKAAILECVDMARAVPPPAGVLYNINIPAIPADQIKGLRTTRMGQVRYQDGYERREDPGGKPYYWLHGIMDVLDQDPDTDIIAVRSGWVSLTPLRAELTDMNVFNQIRKHFSRTTQSGTGKVQEPHR